MHGGSQPTDISLIHRRGSGLVSHHPSPPGHKAKSDRQPPPLPPPQGRGSPRRRTGSGDRRAKPRLTRALKRRGESGRVKGSLRRASPALDPARFTRKRNSQIDESDHISPPTLNRHPWLRPHRPEAVARPGTSISVGPRSAGGLARSPRQSGSGGQGRRREADLTAKCALSRSSRPE